MTRQDGLGTLPFADYADPDPDALPFDQARATSGIPCWRCGHDTAGHVTAGDAARCTDCDCERNAP